jgi:hypothetical protein
MVGKVDAAAVGRVIGNHDQNISAIRGAEVMSEEQLAFMIRISFWFIVGCGTYGILNLAMMIYLLVKVSSLANGLKKFSNWYDNRPCAVHEQRFIEIDKDSAEIKRRVLNLERK